LYPIFVGPCSSRLINAESFYLAIIELCREALYFLSFVYLINNVATRPEFRSAVVAVFLGLIIGAGSVITFFELGIGTEAYAFAGLRDQPHTGETTEFPKPGKTRVTANLTVHITESGLGSDYRGQGSEIKRSQGMCDSGEFVWSHFTHHPCLSCSGAAAFYRILLFLGFVWELYRIGIDLLADRVGRFDGWLSRLLRRRGLVGVDFPAGAYTGCRYFDFGRCAQPTVAAGYFETRPESYNMRFYRLWAALHGYSQHPILGVGLNNGTAAMKEGKQVLWDSGIKVSMAEPIENHYLAVLTEAGPVGFILFFVFFGKVVTIALRALREVAIEVKPLLVGLVGGLASVATQSLADDPWGGAMPSGALLWLFAGLIIAIARHICPASGSSATTPVTLGNP
jgi:hypothetical protein